MRDGETGVLCPVGDVEGMAEAAIQILSDRDRWQAMSARGAADARERFSLDAIVADYEAFYEYALAKPPRRGAREHSSSRPSLRNHVTVFQALVLGLIQGLSEFLPISSSAHLTLAPWLFHWPDPGLAFDVALHFGTLIAVLWYFRAEWIALIGAALRIVETAAHRNAAKSGASSS